MKLLIIGAGQYGQVARETAEAVGSFDKISFLDDSSPLAAAPFSAHKSLFGEYECAFVALGDPSLRREWAGKLTEDGYILPSLINPTAYVSPSAVIGDGCIIEAKAVVNTAAALGCGVFVCAGAVVNHNASVGAFSQIDCGAVVGARAVFPEGTKLECLSFYGEKK